MKFSDDRDVQEFLKDISQSSTGSLNRALAAVAIWEQNWQASLDGLRLFGALGAAELLVVMRERHKRVAETEEEFLIGYAPSRSDLISPSEENRIREWYECFREAFELIAAPDEKLAKDEAEVFQRRFGELVERIARLAMPLERQWTRIGKVKSKS